MTDASSPTGTTPATGPSSSDPTERIETVRPSGDRGQDRPSPLRGVVITDVTDVAVGGAEVTVTDDGGQRVARATTAADGRFVTPSLPLGTYQLTVARDGFYPIRVTVHPHERRAALSLPLVPAELGGQVIAAESSKPVGDADVRLHTVAGDLVGQASTGPDGWFTIPVTGRDAPRDRDGYSHTLTVAADTYTDAALDLTLTDTPAGPLTVTLRPATRSPWFWAGIAAGALLLAALLFALFGSGGSAVVPELAGASVDDATVALEDAELALGELATSVSDAEAGTVVDQSHAAGTEVRTGTEIDLTLAAPAGEVAVPNLTGLRRSAAERELERAGLATGIVSLRPSVESSPDTVLETAPGVGELVEPGSVVDLTLAAEPEADPAVEVPRVTGRQESDAVRLLDDGGFEVAIEREFSDEQVGTVTTQAPTAGDEVDVGSLVTITISRGPEPEPTPEPVPEPEPEPEPAPESATEPESEPAGEPAEAAGDDSSSDDVLPSVRDVELPEVELPEFELPEFELPEVDPDAFVERITSWLRSLLGR